MIPYKSIIRTRLRDGSRADRGALLGRLPGAICPSRLAEGPPRCLSLALEATALPREHLRDDRKSQQLSVGVEVQATSNV